MKVIGLFALALNACFAQAVMPVNAGGELAPPQSQVKPEDRGAIKGQVVNGATGEPLKKASVMLMRTSAGMNEPYQAETDADGNFALTGVDPGTYRVNATRNGFVLPSPAHGARGGPPSITVNSRQTLEGVTVKLMPQAVITGKITDFDGEPLQNVQISVLRYSYANGRRQLMPSGGGMSNDLGEYRVFGLNPGKVYVMASYRQMMMVAPSARVTQSGPEESYPPVYYPSAADPSGASGIDLQPGSEVRAIDIRLQKAKAVHVSGKIAGFTTGAGRYVMISLVPRGENSFAMMGRNMTQVRQSDGTFTIRGVSPGSYMLNADAREENRQLLARVALEVGTTNIDDLTVNLSAGIELTGSVKIEGDQTVKLGSVNLRLMPKENNMIGGSGAVVKPDNTFSMNNVVPDNYMLQAFGLPDNSYVKSIRIGTEDVTDAGLDLTRGAPAKLEIVISTTGGQLSGTVNGPDQKPVSGAMVVLVPDGDRRKQMSYYKQAPVDQNGAYQIKGISPGNYKLFAWESVEYGAYQDPEFLAPYESKGESVSVKESATETKDLKVLE